MKSSDLTNFRYIEQNFLVPSEFVKTRIHSIFKLWCTFSQRSYSQWLFLENKIRTFTFTDDVQRLQSKFCERNNAILFQVFLRKSEK